MDPTDTSQEKERYLAHENQEFDEDSDVILNHLINSPEDETERLAYELYLQACNDNDIVEMNQENFDSRSMHEGMSRNHGLQQTDQEIAATPTANTNLALNVASEVVADPQEMPRSSRMREHKPHICSECGKVFSKKDYLQKHLIVHSGEKPFNCNLCNKKFRHKSHLNEHVAVHSDERTHTCAICKKSFKQQCVLRKHLSTHTNETPHTCDICQKTFTLSASLRRHVNTHTKERSFICEKCGKAFGRKDTLKQHERTHK